MSSASERPAGSPSAGEPALLVVGKIRRPHGVSGEALVEVYADFPERLAPMSLIFVGVAHQPLIIRKQRPHKDGLLLAFENITTPEQVGLLRNQMISIPAADLPSLPDGEYYHHQILGLSIMDEDGQEVGILTEILKTGANDVYVVTRDDGTELLLPAISNVVLDIDLLRKTMRVHLLPGLL